MSRIKINKTLGEVPGFVRTIKIDIRTWAALKNIKKENETFDDVIKNLLNERTKVYSDNKNVELIKYSRKTFFLETSFNAKDIGIEFEYNDIKNLQSEFTLDIKFKKIFIGKQIYNPSIFFGVDSSHLHHNYAYFNLYLKCIHAVLTKEFRIFRFMYLDKDYENTIYWRKLYYEHNLSEESFTSDIVEPFRLSQEDKPTNEFVTKIEESQSYSTLICGY
ncbi:MAG: hypothetical protein V1859_07625 [archaeon]